MAEEAAPAAAAHATGHAMKTKVFGLPLPIVIGLGIGGVLLLKDKLGGSSSAAAVAPANQASQVTAADQLSPTGSAPVEFVNPSGTTSGTATGAISSNTAWGTQATDYLLAQGYTPTTVNDAISGYLAGATLDTTQQALVNLALAQYGSLPDSSGINSATADNNQAISNIIAQGFNQSGFGADPNNPFGDISSPQGVFVLSSPQQVADDLSSGQPPQLWYEPAPGSFAPTAGANVTQGTPRFNKVG